MRPFAWLYFLYDVGRTCAGATYARPQPPKITQVRPTSLESMRRCEPIF